MLWHFFWSRREHSRAFQDLLARLSAPSVLLVRIVVALGRPPTPPASFARPARSCQVVVLSLLMTVPSARADTTQQDMARPPIRAARLAPVAHIRTRQAKPLMLLV